MPWLIVSSIGLFIGMLLRVIFRRTNQHLQFRVTETHLTLPDLPAAFDGYTIALVSDLHADTNMPEHALQRLMHITNAQHPDLIVLGGDYVTYEASHVRAQLVDALSLLKAKDGVLAVLGNHDYWDSVTAIRDILTEAGVRELQNDYRALTQGDDILYVCGMDSLIAGHADMERLAKRLPDETVPAILVAHEPDFADVAAREGRFLLQLSGHTHGGQIRLPFLGGPKVEGGRLYREGHYTIGERLQLYVSRGVGCSMLPLRLNCPPEIAVLTLHSA